jgi:transcriptional regulator with XRE-family HTH domain
MDGWRVMVDDEQPTFRDLLRRARRAAGLTQEELAEKAGLSTRAVSNLERGINQAPQRETFEMLVNALDVTPEERRE